MTAPEFAPPAAKLHNASWQDFETLADGGGGEQVIAGLRAAERSRRLVSLRAIFDLAPELADARSVSSLTWAWELLLQIHRRSPDAVEPALLHPHFGTWAGSVLRRLRGTSDPSAPLWAELSYLSALAAATAIRAGVEFDGVLAAHRGTVVLPTLGFARIHSDTDTEWETVEIRSEAGRVHIGPVDVPADLRTNGTDWFAIHQLSAESAGLVYRVDLDTVDLYREPGYVTPPQHLDDEKLRRWQHLFGQAWSILARHHRDSAEPLATGLTTITPRPAVHPFRTYSGTAEESFGAAVISLPPDATTLAVTLVHEFQHTKLGALLHLVPMYDGDARERLYAPWRPDPRPAPSLLQGVYAFSGVTAFWRTQRKVASGPGARFAHFEFAHWREQTRCAWQTLSSQPGLTEFGRAFVARMGARMEPWRTEAVPADLQALADLLSKDHWATWRIRNVRLSSADVETLADAWEDHRPPPPLQIEESIVSAGRVRPREARDTMIRRQVADPHAFRDFLRDLPPEVIGDLVPGDLAFLNGNYADAAAAYSEEVKADATRAGAWVGLGLSLDASGTHAAATAILESPELVSSVYRELRARKDDPPDPDAVAEWLGR